MEDKDSLTGTSQLAYSTDDEEEPQLLVTRSGLKLRMRPLKPEEADKYFWVAMLPYTWTPKRFAEIVTSCWQMRATCAGLTFAALAACRRRPAVWPLLLAAGALTPTALLHGLPLLMWLFHTRRLPDYHNFSDYWCGDGPNRLYGAFLDNGSADESLVATVASLHVDADTCELQRLGVLPGHRGHGIGDAVCGRLMRLCARRGYRRMRLGTTELQRHAVGIYERLGFVRVAEVRTLILPGVPIYLFERALTSNEE